MSSDNRKFVLLLLVTSILIVFVVIIESSDKGPLLSTFELILVLIVGVLFPRLYELFFILYPSRPWGFVRQAARLYERTNEGDTIFSIAETFDLQKPYLKAYRWLENRPMIKLKFFACLHEGPPLLGLLARIGLLCEESDERFVLKLIPQSSVEIMPPKLAANGEEIILGNRIGGGPSKSWLRVRSPVLSESILIHLEQLSDAGKWEDAEEKIAHEKMDEVIAEKLSSKKSYTALEILNELVPLTSRGDQNWMTEEVIKYACRGIRHLVEDHCKKLKVEKETHNIKIKDN